MHLIIFNSLFICFVFNSFLIYQFPQVSRASAPYNEFRRLHLRSCLKAVIRALRLKRFSLLLLALVAAEYNLETAEVTLGPYEVREGPEEEQGEDQREDDGAGDQSGELVPENQLASEENDTRANGGDGAPHDADSDLPVGFSDFEEALLVE